MTPADLETAFEFSMALYWPHRLVDWEQALRLGEGVVAECEGEVVGTAMRWRWGDRHATIGLVIVDPAHQGKRIGYRLMLAMLDGLDDCTVLLHATVEGHDLYTRLGFVDTHEIYQQQGTALPAPLVAPAPGWRLRRADASDAAALLQLDTAARGMPRPQLLAELNTHSELIVVLDHGGDAKGYAVLRRFGRGLAIGPVIAPDTDGAKVLIAHLAGLSAGRFLRIDIDATSGLSEWLETLGLSKVGAPVTMVRGAALVTDPAIRMYALATQALG
jgi:predicted N-acetyltransferase YhbS